jgi:hypothetical protein
VVVDLQTCGRIYPILGYLDKMDRIYPSFSKMRRISILLMFFPLGYQDIS